MESLEIKEEIKVEIPKKWKILMHNDDYTTMEFVIQILVDIFNKNEKEAEKIMLDIHLNNIGLVGTYHKDIAFTKFELAKQMIKNSGFPLKITIEEE